MANGCIFCKIAAKKLPSKIQYEDENMVAFDDINPKAPVHILIVPKKHIGSVNDLKSKDTELVGKMIFVAQKLAKEKGIAKTGYRIIINTGAHGGQIVDHIHLHLMGGGKLG